MTVDGACALSPGTRRAEFLILAAGAGKRFRAIDGKDRSFGRPAGPFDDDKLTVPVAGISLPQRAVEFAACNGADRVHVTVARGPHGDKVREDVEAIAASLDVDAVIRTQEPSLYGTAAALLPWKGDIGAPTVLLFGDNFYHGALPQLADPDVLYFTYSEAVDLCRAHRSGNRELHRRYAAVLDDRIVEKPHNLVDGPFFTGLLRLPTGFLDALSLEPSPRGELEVADAVNKWPRRRGIRLAETGMVWGDLTYREDLAAVTSLVEGAR